jgi:putative ABC transport system permease protein
MARAPDDQGGATRLVSVKAVSAGYPLRGKLQLRRTPDGPVETVAAAPEPGTVWVDAPLLEALQLHLGDPLLLGDATLRIARIIVIEPDRGAGFMALRRA